MRGNASEDAGVLVLDFTLDDAVAEGTVVRCRRNFMFQRSPRIERRVHHAERPKNFALAEGIERFIGEAFESEAENDESDIAVFGARARGGSEFGREGGLQKGLAGAST